MSTLKLKSEFTNKVVERKSSVSNSMIRADFNKIQEKDYHKYYKVGFQDCFEVEEVKTKQVPVEVIQTRINVTVDDYNDLTKKELIEQCKQKDITIPHNASKQILINLLNAK